MSAAISAAAYLYASGRLRARETGRSEMPVRKLRVPKVRVAVFDPDALARTETPKRVPRIEYRRRRLLPE